MSTRYKSSIWLLALGILLLAAATATASSLLGFGGLFAIAITVRYRKRPSLWASLVFGILVIGILIITRGPPSSPLIAFIPLMLSYVFDYIDEQRQKRAAVLRAALAGETRPAEPSAPPNGDPATQPGNSGVAYGPPSVN